MAVSTMFGHKCTSSVDEFGLVWCDITIHELWEFEGTHVIGIRKGSKNLDVYISPTGRSIRVYLNRRELK